MTADAVPATPRAPLLIAAVSLAAYPALRPYSSEVGLDGADAFASPAWLASHLLGMVGFVALAWALHRAANPGVGGWSESVRHREGWPARTAGWAAAGTCLLLPYYGAEAYGLQAIGTHAVSVRDGSLLEAADAFRYAPVPLTLFVLGFLAWAVAGARVAHGLNRASQSVRVGSWLVAATLVTYLPQFFAPPAGRIAHGLVLGLGLLLISLGGRRTP